MWKHRLKCLALALCLSWRAIPAQGAPVQSIRERFDAITEFEEEACGVLDARWVVPTPTVPPAPVPYVSQYAQFVFCVNCAGASLVNTDPATGPLKLTLANSAEMADVPAFGVLRVPENAVSDENSVHYLIPEGTPLTCSRIPRWP